ncbi:protein FAR1-RELATED SEQUENCE 5-like [Chenopodium quinoa]|uniref:protein FAR1-RELATED SEQUENCE 5-like n=1 Tax=Chenopodium quinoa TaxID=63459 RepID=UPI000B7869E3|nr:protein FAR1-RELATED SEQUENCE 5-like [Chenopodium quinoa]
MDSLIHKLLQSQKQIQAAISNDLQTSKEIEVDSAIDVDLNNDSMQQTLNCRQCGNNIDLNCEINDNAMHQNLNSDSYESRVILDEQQISADEVQISVDEEQISEDEDSTSEVIETNIDVGRTLLGIRTKTLEEMHEIYKKHVSIVGFSVRKHTGRTRDKTGKVIVEKYYVCSAQGKTNTGERKKKKIEAIVENAEKKKKRKPRQVPITRTDCRACIRVKMNEDGLFEVVQHVLVHNHDLTRKQWHYLHRSEREMTEEKGQVIENLQDFQLWTHIELCAMKMEVVIQAVSEIMYQELANDPEFFFRFRLNKEGKLRALFWRDSMMREDYSIYGDVVVFDTTYRTNRHNLICAPIVGINNHWKNCMFGCAFIRDEKIESFVWLLETFKKSMGGKCPISIFTNQDQAMCSAIQKLPYFSKNISDYNSGLSRVEFETEWNSMIEKYNLQEDSWFQRIYDLKAKTSSQLISSLPNEVKRWRSTEKHDEFSRSKSTASSAIPLSGLLKHASEIYTLSLFTDFEEEFGYFIATTSKLLWQNGSTLFYLVEIESEPWSQQKVIFESDSNQVKCTCKNFEASGWLCYHCIRILHLH